jgi:hypothetical protein
MGAWAFLHPWLLVGLVGASLPIIIHLIGRRRAPTIHFAAFDFLLAVNKRLARREKLRQLLLLVLRTLAVIAIVLAVARPVPSRSSAAPLANRRIAVVLDASASMRYVLGGRTLLERAKTQASELLSHLQPGDSATLVIADTRVHSPFQAPTLDTAAVRAAVESVNEAKGIADLGAAIDVALGQLGPTPAGASLVIVSDLAQNSFAHLKPFAVDPAPEIQLLDAAEREEPVALPNLAVDGVVVEASGDAPATRRVRITVRNFAGEAVAERAVSVLIDDRVTQRAFAQVPALGTAEKMLTQSFDGSGVFHGRAELGADGADGYADDDVASFVAVVVPGIDVLVVNGDPRTTPYEDELFFVEKALEVLPKGDAPLRLRLATVDELAAGAFDLTSFKVVLLANVGELPPGVVTALRELVVAGGGLLFAPGDNLRFERANEVFGDLLARPLRDVHRAADPDAGTAPLGIGEMDWDHPVLAGLGNAAEESLRASRTATLVNLDLGTGSNARTVLRFDNGAPALMERPLAAGRVMVLCTSVDVDWSDLALRSAWPALLQRTMRYLGGALDVAPVPPVRNGGAVDLALPTAARGIALVSPSGVRREELATDGETRRARFADLTEDGIFRAEVLHERWQAEPRLDVPVSPSLEESDFAPVTPREIAAALGGPAEGDAVAVRLGIGSEEDPFAVRGAASFLLLALALFFVSESLLASRG